MSARHPRTFAGRVGRLFGWIFGLIVVALVVGGWVMGPSLSGYVEAVEKREQLERIYGTAQMFVPWSDGRIPADRLAAYLQVRRELEPWCAPWTKARGALQRFDKAEGFPAVGALFGADLGAGKGLVTVFQSLER